MCTLLRAMGLPEPSQDVLRPTALALDCLVAGGHLDLRPYYASMRERPACRELYEVLRTGKPAAWASAEACRDWATKLTDVSFARQLTAAMDARATVLALPLVDALGDVPARGLLDIAGGSGSYAAVLVHTRRGLAATVLERVPVDAVASVLLAERGDAGRVEVVAGDMFEELPADHDLHLLSHTLYNWDEEGVRRILEVSFGALPAGGWLVDHDTHVNADKTGPLAVARYSVLLPHSARGSVSRCPN